MTYDTMLTLIGLLGAVITFSGIAILRNMKQQSLAEEFKPVQTPLDLKRKAWADAQRDLIRRVK